MNSRYTRSFKIPANHPCLKGHFPGFPVLPAVAQISMLTETLSSQHEGKCEITSIPVAKFLHPVRPDSVLNVELLQKEANCADFVIHCANRVVAKGRMTFRISTP